MNPANARETDGQSLFFCPSSVRCEAKKLSPSIKMAERNLGARRALPRSLRQEQTEKIESSLISVFGRRELDFKLRLRVVIQHAARKLKSPYLYSP